MKAVAVTGASGFIGTRLVEVLAARGDTVVHAIVPPRSNPSRIARHGRVRVSVGDVCSPPFLAGALAGCDAVFHCAYGTRGTMETQRHVTVDGTIAVVDSARRLDIPRVVHLSSAAVFGYDAEGWRDESSSYGTRLDGYCRDKKDAEEAIIAHVRPGMAPTAAVLLPTLVYGPYSPFVVDVIRRMSAGRFGLPPRSGSANHVYVDDLVHAMLRAATTPIETVDRFIVSAVPPEPYTAFFERFARMAGIGRVPHAAPRPMEPTAPPSVRRLLRRFAADREFRDLVNRVPGFSYGYQKAKRRWPALTARVTRDVSRPVVAPAASEASGPTLTPNEWTFYSANVTFSGEKAVKTFGAPPVGIDEGMRRTAAWLRHIGLIR